MGRVYTGVGIQAPMVVVTASEWGASIRECSTTLYVGLAHAAPPTQYKAFMALSTNWLTAGSTSRYMYKE